MIDSIYSIYYHVVMNEPRDVLQMIRARQGLTIDDLVEEAASLLPTVADHQTRYKVTDRPDVRTIRYYVTRGLLPRANGYDGGRARYGGTHLIRSLLIKNVAQHVTGARRSWIICVSRDLDDSRPGGVESRLLRETGLLDDWLGVTGDRRDTVLDSELTIDSHLMNPVSQQFHLP